ncbi:MAG TPA: hypothetical protein VJY62_23060, partial [Bacteroidia bacterium]|nr:hypothetical protein [Bacteroidia bacterium]
KSSSGYDTHLKNIHSLKEFEYYKILVENRNDKFKLYYYNQFSLHLDFLHTINKKLKIDFDEYNKKFQDTQDMWKMNYEKIVDSINYFRKIQPNDFSVSILQTWSDYHNKNAENNSRLDPYFIKKNLFPELLAVSRTFANVDFIILIQRAIHSFNNLNYQRELYLMDLKSIAFYSKSSCLRLMIVKKFYER